MHAHIILFAKLTNQGVRNTNITYDTVDYNYSVIYMDKQNNSFSDLCDIEDEQKIMKSPNYSKQAKKFPGEQPLVDVVLQEPIIPGKRSNSMDKENPDKHVKASKVNL